ncbi:hypothetical protein BPAE_0210g00080 [Botrytis paeoniae]|uniref:C2H2-type domain-containing protein n=1 Tax=Botrytis paeoniae TaxID=278948 RepID=A0A4Z1FG29_9HELO|nr:hypothetical protein BPAE_0210g00080 [Botrytis paeoniae]
MMGLWPLGHDVVLFAWLDFCNKHKIDYLATIEREFEEKTEVSRSRAAVCSHLRYTEWRYRQPNEKRRIQNDELVPHIGIIEKGSQGLRYPLREMTLKIRKALREYEKEYSPDRIQELVKTTSKKNKPSLLKVQPLPRSSPPVRKPEYSSSHNRKRVSPPEDGEYSNKKRCVEKNTKSIPPQKQRRKLELQRPQLTSTLKSATLQPLNDRSPTKRKLSNVQPGISHLSKTPSVDGEGDDKVTEPTQKHIEEIISKGQESYKKLLKEKEAEIIAIREFWDCDLRELHERIEKLQQANLELEAKNSSLESAVIDVIRGIKEAQVKYLPHQDVNIAMNEIRLDLETVTQMQDFSIRVRSKEWFGGDLDHLVNSAFASPQGSIDGRIRLKRLALRIGSSAVLSLLTITALRDWVFLTDFPRVELGSLSLIEAYRSIAFNQGGWDELRCYDFGAFKEHMKKSYFKEELIRTARKLACRLSKSLSLIFGESLEDVNAFQQEEPGTFEVARNNSITIDKISEPMRNIPQLPLQLSNISSELRYKTCERSFEKNQRLMAHQRNKTCRRCKACRKVWPTIAALKEHNSKNHNEEIENLASSTNDHAEPQPTAIPVSKREIRSNVAIEKGICEKNDIEENDAEEDDVEKNDLDLYSAKALESVNNGETDHPHTTKSRTYSLSEIPSSIGFEQEEGEEPGSAESVPCPSSTIETDDTNLLPKGNRTGGEELDSASPESDSEELTTPERKHACEKIELGKEDLEGSVNSTHRSNSQTTIGLDDSFLIDSETLGTKEDAALDLCGQKTKAEPKSSSTTGSSISDVNLESLEVQSPGHWAIAEGCDTSNFLFESLKLIPERRASQLFLVITENEDARDEDAGDEDADEDKSPEVNTPENDIAEAPKGISATEDESTGLGKHEGKNENYKSHDVDEEEGVKVDNNNGREATEGGFVRDKTDENESFDDTGTAEAMSRIKDIIREMCEEYTAWTVVTTKKTVEAANDESIAGIIKKLCEDFASVVVMIDETPEAESEKAIDVDDIAYHEAQEAEGVDVTTQQHIEGYVNNTDMAKYESRIEVEENRVMDEDIDVHDDMTAETKIEKSIELSTNEPNDTESDQPHTRENQSADRLFERDSTVHKVQEQGSSIGNKGGYSSSFLWFCDRFHRSQQQGKSNDLEVQSEVHSEEKMGLEIEEDNIDEVQSEV